MCLVSRQNRNVGPLGGNQGVMTQGMAPSQLGNPDADEAQLIARLQARDERAFDEFERAYAPRLFAIAKRMCRDEHEAADATQEAFAGAYRTLGTFDGRSKLGTWLTRIVINKCLVSLRTRRRRPAVSLDELLPKFAADGHASVPAPHWQRMDEEEASQRLRELVQEQVERLPDHYRTVLILRDVQGLSTEEVANVLEETPNAVKIRLHRARQVLKAMLDPHMRREKTE
jgi:RNA polymerase sigma-70 factor, ECF subfamily